MSDAIPNRGYPSEQEIREFERRVLLGEYDSLVQACYADPEVQVELKLWEGTLMDGLEEQDDA